MRNSLIDQGRGREEDQAMTKPRKIRVFTYVVRLNDYYAKVALYEQGVEVERYVINTGEGEDWKVGLEHMQGNVYYCA